MSYARMSSERNPNVVVWEAILEQGNYPVCRLKRDERLVEQLQEGEGAILTIASSSPGATSSS